MKRWETLDRKLAPHLIPKFGALSGMRVICSGTVIGGPYAAQLLADFGAEVIHIELPGMGDPYRHLSPQITSDDGSMSTSVAYCQKRNHLSLGLNTNFTKNPEAKEIFLSLIKQSDVWLENMVWIEKLGISIPEIFEVNPKLVIVHVSGFGRPQFGGDPETCNRASYDPIGQAESGWMNNNGEPDGPPVYASVYINDYMTALYAFGACLSGYINVKNGGLGQEIDVSQVEAQARCLDDHWACYANLGIEKRRFGNRIPIFQPANMHKCKDGRYVYIAALGKDVYYRFIDALGVDPVYFKYEEAGASKEAVDSLKGKELFEHYDAWISNRNAQEVQDHMSIYKVPVAIVKTVKDIYEEPHWHSRNNFIKYKVPAINNREVEAFGFVPKFMDTPGEVWRGQNKIGGDSEIILKDLLGYTNVEIESFKNKKII